MLHTTQQIAEKYGVTPYTITHNWIPKGLRHIPGARKSYLYKLEWVEEFLENQADMCTFNKLGAKQDFSKRKINPILKNKKFTCFVS